MSENYKNNDKKMDYLLNVWYNENFDKQFIGKTNLDLNKVVEMSSSGTNNDYYLATEEKQTPKISKTEIVLEKNQPNLKLIFWCNTGCYDLSNFQTAIMNNSYRKDLKRDINECTKNPGKTAVIMSNVIGKEWELNYLRTAIIKIGKDNGNSEDITTSVRRLYYGIKKRKERLINDIKFCLNNGAHEVYLMKGLEEFKILKNTGVDVFADVVKLLNDNRLKYISEGTMTKVNLVKKNSGKNAFYNLIKFSMNNDSKSQNPAVMEIVSEIRTKEKPDATFVCGGNFTASIGNDNVFYPSGQLNYINTTKGKNPDHMVNDGNIFVVYPECSHSLTIMKGGKGIYNENSKVLNNAYNEKKKVVALAEIINEKIESKINELIAKPIIVAKKQKYQNRSYEEK